MFEPRPAMTDDRAMRVAVTAGEQAAEKNPELAAQLRANYTRFIRRVWGGPSVQPFDSTKRSEQFVGECDERMAPRDETVRA
jgi:hypothetical protein